MQPRLLVYVTTKTLEGHQEMDNLGASGEKNEVAESRERRDLFRVFPEPFLTFELCASSVASIKNIQI